MALLIGEAQAIHKLKMVNRELKWQLEQRNRCLTSNKSIMDSLLLQLAASQEHVHKLQKERDDLQEKVSQLRAVTSEKMSE